MTAQGWRESLLHAFHRYTHYDDDGPLMGFAQCLAEEDEAKQLLRDAGFGCTGMSLLRTVKEAVEWAANAHNPSDGANGL